MSEVKVNKISPRTACGTVTLGDSGDTFTIPSGATITNAGTASGFGATGETSWDTTVKTTGTFTATAGVGYFLNTTGGIITVNLAAGTAGDSVALADYAGTWQTNNVTVTPNGSEKIGGVAAGVTLSTEGQAVTFVYIDGTQGWVNVLDSTSNVRGNAYMTATVSGACNTLATAPDCANTKIATFLGPGTFCVSAAAVCAANNLVSYMVVAGGGGSASAGGGGGGAGGFREYESPVTPYTSSPLDGNPGGTAITVSAAPYAITVGGGGAGGTPYPGAYAGANGDNSVFSSITSAGGGAGAQSYSSPSPNFPGGKNIGSAGGSGGGGGYACTGNPSPSSTANPLTQGGAGDTPPTTPDQGFPGGAGQTGWYGNHGAGGGATAVGGTASGPSPGPGGAGGNGGAGATTSISASPTAYAGGGGGPAYPGATGGTGGLGGGGAGTSTDGVSGGVGGVNTGGGGGGVRGTVGANGGSGIVIIRYKFQ